MNSNPALKHQHSASDLGADNRPFPTQSLAKSSGGGPDVILLPVAYTENESGIRLLGPPQIVIPIGIPRQKTSLTSAIYGSQPLVVDAQLCGDISFPRASIPLANLNGVQERPEPELCLRLSMVNKTDYKLHRGYDRSENDVPNSMSVPRRPKPQTVHHIPTGFRDPSVNGSLRLPKPSRICHPLNLAIPPASLPVGPRSVDDTMLGSFRRMPKSPGAKSFVKSFAKVAQNSDLTSGPSSTSRAIESFVDIEAESPGDVWSPRQRLYVNGVGPQAKRQRTASPSLECYSYQDDTGGQQTQSHIDYTRPGWEKSTDDHQSDYRNRPISHVSDIIADVTNFANSQATTGQLYASGNGETSKEEVSYQAESTPSPEVGNPVERSPAGTDPTSVDDTSRSTTTNDNYANNSAQRHNKVFACSHCGIKFSSQKTLEGHQQFYCKLNSSRTTATGSTTQQVLSSNNSSNKVVASKSRSNATSAGSNCLRQLPFGSLTAPGNGSLGQQAQEYCCQFCDFTAATTVQLLQHAKQAHALVQSYLCTLCGYKGYSIRGMKSHLKMSHRDIAVAANYRDLATSALVTQQLTPTTSANASSTLIATSEAGPTKLGEMTAQQMLEQFATLTGFVTAKQIGVSTKRKVDGTISNSRRNLPQQQSDLNQGQRQSQEMLLLQHLHRQHQVQQQQQHNSQYQSQLDGKDVKSSPDNSERKEDFSDQPTSPKDDGGNQNEMVNVNDDEDDVANENESKDNIKPAESLVNCNQESAEAYSTAYLRNMYLMDMESRNKLFLAAAAAAAAGSVPNLSPVSLQQQAILLQLQQHQQPQQQLQIPPSLMPLLSPNNNNSHSLALNTSQTSIERKPIDKTFDKNSDNQDFVAEENENSRDSVTIQDSNKQGAPTSFTCPACMMRYVSGEEYIAHPCFLALGGVMARTKASSLTSAEPPPLCSTGAMLEPQDLRHIASVVASSGSQNLGNVGVNGAGALGPAALAPFLGGMQLSAQQSALVASAQLGQPESPPLMCGGGGADEADTGFTTYTAPDTGVAKYACKFCSYASAHKGNVKRHLSLVHKAGKGTGHSPSHSGGSGGMPVAVSFIA